MNVAQRLAKLEQKSGINQPCEWCAYWNEQYRLVEESLLAQGIKPYQPEPHEVRIDSCRDCGHTNVIERSFMNADDYAESARLGNELVTTEPEGQQFNCAWWAAWLSLYDRQQARIRAYYGPAAYDEAIADTGFVHVREFALEQIEEVTL